METNDTYRHAGFRVRFPTTGYEASVKELSQVRLRTGTSQGLARRPFLEFVFLLSASGKRNSLRSALCGLKFFLSHTT